MAFSLTRPPSPIRESHISMQGQDEDHLSSALHAALSNFLPGSSTHPDHQHDMIKEKERAGIDIIVDSDYLSLKGTGVDVEPALLKGHIVLHLKEPTSIKEITLQFRGKAKLPTASAESLALGNSPQWYTICNHDWSFLEGEKRHSHTLKAGYHQFPFQLQLGGSLPSSITSTVYGGAHVTYKLRAVAVRPGLAPNMQAVMPISIVRTFAAEALEYQQSLEIENTWPEKLMYSIMIPHKAWAAGDKLTAIVKFSPLSKGVHVLTVTTTISETTKVHYKGGVQEHTRSVVTANHEITNGNAVPMLPDPYGGLRGPPVSTSSPPTPGLSSEDRAQSFGSLAANQDLSLRQISSRASSSSSSSRESYSTPAPPPPPSGSVPSAEPTPSTSTANAGDEVPISQDDVVTQLNLFIPTTITPSHPLEPLTVSHRIRWSILMSNLDGHTSELRCSLPLHILDGRLLNEARANTAVTRRLLLGAPEVPLDEERDTELPSYSAHVRDRVANMYFPDSATTRVINPWVHSGVSPTFMPEHQSLSGAWTLSHSQNSNVGNAGVAGSPVTSHPPHAPRSGTSTPLEWVESELLFSLSNAGVRGRTSTASSQPHSPIEPTSQPASRLTSRRGSRAPSPERDRHLTMTPMTTTTVSALHAPVSAIHETFMHDSLASRTLPGLFSIQMKPHMSITSPGGWLSSRSNSHSNLASMIDGNAGHGAHGVYRSPTLPGQTQSHFAPTRHATSMSLSLSMTPGENRMSENELWHRAFTEVPDYDVASRGFIGGVTPLTSMRGLPSYEEAERASGTGAAT